LAPPLCTSLAPKGRTMNARMDHSSKRRQAR
jgi:hypothetical protein